MCEIYSTLTRMTPERLQWRRSRVFAVNFETEFTHCSHAKLTMETADFE